MAPTSQRSTVSSIYRLGHLQDFLRRATELNQVHNPEDPVHAYLGMDADAWRAATEGEAPPARDPAAASELAIAVVARKSLSSLHREFPTGAPAHEQAAYLLRGFAGLQPFAAASDVTGWDLVAETLEHHGFDLLAESEDGRALVTELWRRLQASHPRFSRRDLLERDDAFAWLAEWFSARIVATGVKADIPDRHS
ncbi:MAG: hypothetical protein ABR562_07275 [Thermoplasmatota archaeon]